MQQLAAGQSHGVTRIYTLVQGSCAPFQDCIDVGFGHEQRGHISLYPPSAKLSGVGR